ncbi:lamin tail domain-containing protein [Rhodopirellula sp. SWK7]|uniref:lamin tail domain-containing protein n=1 Tax=Rhodopirellula sp. SWK7 TaxID=595460 RepID=UPI0002BE8F56|nr:lamin tail domain-containing protein [Rhodopirellula sp. SWK7]EMI42520.1 Na-Ca exchanger/integrin-beta4 domain protein [Rhodopirellula sp. SWK7]
MTRAMNRIESLFNKLSSKGNRKRQSERRKRKNRLSMVENLEDRKLFAVLGGVDFETQGSGYSTSIAEFSDGSGDFFTQVPGNSIGGFYSVTGQEGAGYFAAMDLDGEGDAATQTLTMDSVDITGKTNLSFSVMLAEDDDGTNQDWDAADYAHFQYQIDGGGFQDLLWVEADISSGSNGTPLIDTDFDGVGDGTEVTSTFTTFTAAIPGGGSSLDIKAEISLDSGDEDLAIDLMQVLGDDPGGATTVSVSALDADKAEGNSGTTAFTFEVTRGGDVTGTSDVTWTLNHVDTDAADFSGSLTGTVSFAATETSKTVTVDVVGDTTVESDEDFTVTLSSPVGATIATATANGTIQDDDTVSAGLDTFINEFHYDDSTGSGDVGESVEIAGPAGKDLTGWTVVRYNGSNGTVYGTDTLSGTIVDSGNGFGFVTVDYPTNGLQNGSPDGIALVDDNGDVVQFLSYEGTLTATSGPAAGMTSEDVGVSETNSTTPGTSLQLGGSGALYSDFTWQASDTETSGAINNNQTFLGSGSTTLNIAPLDAVKAEGDAGTTAYTFRVTRVGDTSGTSSVAWTKNDVDTNASDFSGSVSGTVNFLAGEVSKDITINVVGDTTAESNEDFTVSLSSPVDATIGNASASGTIQDDDTALSSAVINEFVFNHTGSDSDEFIEVFGAPSEDLSAYSVVVIDGSGSGTGQIVQAYTLGTSDSNGYQLAGGGYHDNVFTNGADQSILLVKDFTGSVGTDLDTDDDGTLDSTPWTAEIDSVALGDNADQAYSTSVLTVSTMDDGITFDVGGASRISNGLDTDSAGNWRRNDFGGEGLPSIGTSTDSLDIYEAVNTPLADNLLPIPITPALTIVESDGSTDVSESGATDSFTVGLTTNPSSAVTVTVTPDSQVDLGSGAGTAITLTFNDRTAQTVSVSGVDDMTVEAAIHTGLISISAASSDGDYNGKTGSVTANIADNDTSAPATFLNEFVINHRGTDTDDFVEVRTTPGSVLSSLTLLSVGSSGSFSGNVDAAEALGTADGNGFHVITPTDPLGFFNETTLVLVEGFTGAVNDDLDVDDDGVFDWEQGTVPAGGLTAAPWTNVRDAVAVHDGGNNSFGFVELTQTTLNDGDGFGPGGASRIPDATSATVSASEWVRNDFEGQGLANYPFDTVASNPGTALNTPGALNSLLSGIGVTETYSGTSVEEGGAGDSILLSLDGVAPTGNVTVTITPDAQLDLGAGGGTAITQVFNATSGPFSIDIDAVDDGTTEGPHSGLISFEITASTDANYIVGTTATDLSVNITDNEAGGGTPNVLISELMYNPASSESGPLGEWVEIVNTGSGSVNIGGWVLDDEDSSDWGEIPSGTTLTAGQVAVLFDTDFTTEATFRTEWGVPTGSLVIGVPWGSLSNSPTIGNEVLQLLDGAVGTGSVVDEVDYDDGGDWPSDNGRSSVYLTNLASDNNVGTNWAAHDVTASPAQDPVPTTPTGSTYDATDEGSPGFVPAFTAGATTVSIGAAADGYEATSPLSVIDGRFVVTQTGVSATDTVIAYTVTGSAAEGTDFATLSGSVTVLAGQTTAAIDIDVTDDSGFEGTESVEITLDSISSGSATIDAGGDNAAISIFDNETATGYALGDVIVNEIMKDSDAVGDSDGEYFEVYNTTGSAIDLNGWTISDNDTDSHVISNGGPLSIPAGGYLVLGTNADVGTNGGITVDYEYSGFFLGNGDDEVVLEDALGTEIDRVEYTDADFPDVTGASLEFLPSLLGGGDDHTQNDLGANWQASTTLIGAGPDFGTPGAINSSASPEINVTGLTFTINDGDVTPSSTDGTDFGGVVIGSPVTSTFTIENQGAASLDVSAISLTGVDAGEFSISNVSVALPTSVASAGSITFDVTFNPTAVGAKNATVEITNTDLDEGTYDFAITGSATAALSPEITVESNFTEIVDGDTTPDAADNTDFGSVDVTSGLAVETYFISNDGTSDLTISAGGVTFSGAAAADFTAIAATGSSGFDPAVGVVIAPGDTASFSVEFDASATGARNATVNIASDDADENPYDFAITGNGVNAATNIVINEVDADTPGNDADEFIELFGPAGTSLDGLTVVLYNGSDDASYDSIDLDGHSIPADGYFVIGSASVPNVDLVSFTTNGIQNGADAVALVVGDATSYPNDTPIASLAAGNIVDAMVYDTNDGDDSALLTGVGETTQYNEDENSDKDNHSNSRVPNGLDSSPFVAQLATPGENNSPSSDVTPPTITDVIVGSTSWAASFIDVVDGASNNGIGLSLPGADQTNELPWINIDTIVVEFSEDVQKAGGGDIDLSDISLGGINVVDYELSGSGLSTVYSDGGGAGPYLLTITYTAPTPLNGFDTDRLVLTVADTVQDAAGNALDGEWTNDSTLVSGDTVAGGSAEINFNILEADVSRDGLVFANDTITINSSQFSSPASPGYNAFADLDGSGLIFANDTANANARQFNSLPGGSPTPPSPSTASSAAASSGSVALLSEDEGSWDESVDDFFAEGGLF